MYYLNLKSKLNTSEGIKILIHLYFRKNKNKGKSGHPKMRTPIMLCLKAEASTQLLQATPTINQGIWNIKMFRFQMKKREIKNCLLPQNQLKLLMKKHKRLINGCSKHEGFLLIYKEIACAGALVIKQLIVKRSEIADKLANNKRWLRNINVENKLDNSSSRCEKDLLANSLSHPEHSEVNVKVKQRW